MKLRRRLSNDIKISAGTEKIYAEGTVSDTALLIRKGVPLIRKLKEYGVLKAVKASDAQRNMSDLLDEDIEVADAKCKI